MSSDEVADSRVGCRHSIEEGTERDNVVYWKTNGKINSDLHSIEEGTVDVPIRLFRQILSARNALF